MVGRNIFSLNWTPVFSGWSLYHKQARLVRSEK
jgi:hypothetical protein